MLARSKKAVRVAMPVRPSRRKAVSSLTCNLRLTIRMKPKLKATIEKANVARYRYCTEEASVSGVTVDGEFNAAMQRTTDTRAVNANTVAVKFTANPRCSVPHRIFAAYMNKAAFTVLTITMRTA